MYRLLVAASAVVLSLWGAAAPASAQSTATLREFCADRPGKGSASCILDRGHVQLEVSAFDGARQTTPDTRTDSWSAGSVVARFGVAEATEVQVGLPVWNRETTLDRATGIKDVSEGTGDLYLAVRQGLLRPDGGGISVALMGYATVPTGARAVRASGVEGGVIVPISVDLGGDWGLGLSPTVEIVRDGDGEGSHTALTMVGDIDRDFGDWILGTELWVSRDDDPIDPTTQASVDLIAIWNPAIMPNAQIDFGLNFGLNDDSPDVEFGLGLARRF